MPFAKAFFPQMKSQLCVPPWATPMLIPQNIGFFYVLFMAYGAVPTIGMTRSTPFSSLLACVLPVGILAFTLVLFKTPQTRQACRHSILSVWDSMLTTLFISKGSWCWISLLLSADQTVQGWLHRDSELVSWCLLFVVYYAFFCLHPS